nr:Os03g0195475 [Ipomoea batatas]
MAETQNRFGLFFFCTIQNCRKARKIIPTTALSHFHCTNHQKTARKTDTISVCVVKCCNPSMPFSCCKHISIAVPPINPVMVECDKKSTIIPSLKIPKVVWIRPEIRVAVNTKLR